MTTPSTRPETLRNGRVLTERQADRRRFMQGLAASGGLATAMMAGPGLLRAGAQATPAASPAASPVAAFDGPLASEQVLRLAITEPTTMDPGVSFGDDELSIFFNIYDGLTGIDQATGEIVPRVAESWEPNEDASVWTFHLRDDARWSDGTPITAEDFVYSWQRVLNPDTLSEYTSAMDYVKNSPAINNEEMEYTELGVKAVDERTLEVQMEGPSSAFPRIVATWTYFPVPKHVVDADPEGWTEVAPGVSNGPFIVESWAHDQSMVLVANPEYAGDPVTLTRAEYTIMEDTSTQAYIAFENDELDYAAPEGPDLDRVLTDPEASKLLIQFPLSNCFFAVCDTSQEPTSSVEFRQALYKAINRDELANTVLRGQYLPAYTVMSPDIPGSLKDESPLTESPEEAAQLLADAGIDPASVNLELTYVNSPARLKTISEYLQATWQDALGITVTLAPIEDSAYSDWRASRENEPYGAYTGSWGSDFADPSNWLNQNFTSSADHYRNHWVNEEFDSLCATAISNTNIDERNAQYSEAETILVTEAPIIPLYRGKAARALKPYVKDVYFQSVLSVLHLRTVKIAEH